MKMIVIIVHILISLAVIGLILIQSNKGGLGSAFGGGGEFYRSKRGAERIIFYVTIISVILFFITSIVNLFIR